MRRGGEIVAVILAASLGLALNVFIVAAFFEAQHAPGGLPIGLSDNATQVLTGWGGGIVGVIGALVGVHVGERKRKHDDEGESDDA